jgi:hemoglobin
MADRPSIFEFAGGERAFLALASAHHERCLQDPVLNHPFSHPGQPDHLERLAAYWAEVFGGPARYSELWGDQSTMLEVHARTGAGDDFGPRFVACFMQAADDVGLPEDGEFRDVLRAYMTWAVGDVLSYSPGEAQVPNGLQIRQWTWTGPE